MKYLAFVIALTIAAIIGYMSVSSFSGDSSQFKKPKPYRHLADKIIIHNPALPKPEYISKTEVIIEEKNVTHIHLPEPEKTSESATTNSGTQRTSLKNKKDVQFIPGQRTSTETPETFTNAPGTKEETITYIKNNFLTFESIGTKVFSSGDKEFPGLFTFFSYKAKGKSISLIWLVNFKNHIFHRKITYTETKVGLNRAVIFLNKDEFPDAPEDNKEFLKMLNVQLIFQVGTTEIAFKDAKIGEFDSVNKIISENKKALKTRLETDIKLSDNYNPVFQ